MFFLIVFNILVILYLISRLTIGKTRSPTCLVGKTAIVTGGNAGIGYEIALNLASRGCRVIIADKDDSEKSRKNIIEATGNQNVIVKHLDLGSLKSVRNFAQIINATEKRLDILINNAGIGASVNQYTQDGLHPLMQSCTFGHFLLTHLLMDLLKKSAPSRIIFTTALYAFIHNLTLETLNFPSNHAKDMFTQAIPYGNANVANIMISDIMAERLKGTGVTCNVAHPGVTNSELFTRAFKDMDIYPTTKYLTNLILTIYGKNNWEGSQTAVHLAVSKDLEKTTGCHFWDCKPFPRPPLANNHEFSRKVFQKCEELVGLSSDEKLYE